MAKWLFYLSVRPHARPLITLQLTHTAPAPLRRSNVRNPHPKDQPQDNLTNPQLRAPPSRHPLPPRLPPSNHSNYPPPPPRRRQRILLQPHLPLSVLLPPLAPPPHPRNVPPSPASPPHHRPRHALLLVGSPLGRPRVPPGDHLAAPLQRPRRRVHPARAGRPRLLRLQHGAGPRVAVPRAALVSRLRRDVRPGSRLRGAVAEGPPAAVGIGARDCPCRWAFAGVLSPSRWLTKVTDEDIDGECVPGGNQQL